MISYSLVCDNSHKFDAWFKSADAFDEQSGRGIVACPMCNSTNVHKALMAPAVSRMNSDKVSLSTSAAATNSTTTTATSRSCAGSPSSS